MARRKGRLTPLPREFDGSAFRTAEARQAGVSEKPLRSRDLTKPSVGVRSTGAPTGVPSLCAAYAPKLAPGEFFSHVTAAILHGMWLPLEVEQRLLLHVAVI